LDSSVSGFNVTIPYKVDVIELLDKLSDEAEEIGAVNVIQKREGLLIGHNTDAFGFHQMIKPFLTNKHERAMIIGTGGASKAIHYVFRKIGIDCVFISRNPIGENQFHFDEINDHMLRACKVIVNCTPVGTFPDVNACVNFPFQFLTDEHLVIDLIYNPQKTKFLGFSEKQGATILNGETMLREQAMRAWEIWSSQHSV
jgi:shikimate dehydrogenase